MARLQDQINKQVLDATGFDVPELCDEKKFSRHEILQALRSQKVWFENFANDCNSQIDNIIANNFTLDERLDEPDGRKGE